MAVTSRGRGERWRSVSSGCSTRSLGRHESASVGSEPVDTALTTMRRKRRRVPNPRVDARKRKSRTHLAPAKGPADEVRGAEEGVALAEKEEVLEEGDAAISRLLAGRHAGGAGQREPGWAPSQLHARRAEKVTPQRTAMAAEALSTTTRSARRRSSAQVADAFPPLGGRRLRGAAPPASEPR